MIAIFTAEKTNANKKTPLRFAAFFLPFMVGATWYGSQMGSGTASGALHMTYFVRFGYYGVIFSGLALLVELWFYFWAVELSRTTNTFSTKEFLSLAFHPFEKVLLPIYDIMAICAFSATVSSCIAGAAELLNTYLGINYYLGLIITAALFIVLTMFGISAIRAVGTVLTVAMITIIILFIVAGLPANWESIVQNWTSRAVGEGEKYGSLGWGIWHIFLFASMQVPTASILSTACKGCIKTGRDSLKAVLFGFVCLFITMVPISLLLFGRWPANLESGTSIYVLEAIQNLENFAFLKIAYPLLLASAFITTGPNYIFNLSERWSSITLWDKFKNPNTPLKKLWLRKFIIAVLFCAVCVAMAVNGFGFVTNTILPLTSYGWFAIFIIFALFVPVKVMKNYRKLKKAVN